MKPGYVYILSNKNRTTLYTGVTNNIERRVAEHKSGIGSKFTKKYNCHDLMYYEYHQSIRDAIHREKVLKKWKRAWKLDLIKSMNESMADLSADWELPDVVSEYGRGNREG
jgi:putative endonuclease